MPTGKGFKDEFLLSIKLKCLAAPWLPSPTRQEVKLKANFKKETLKARYKIAPTTVTTLNVGRGFSPTKHRTKTQNVAINDDLVSLHDECLASTYQFWKSVSLMTT